MSRRERERERHRQEILNSACKVFSEKGYKNATIADISKNSEFSIASIYKHFESKEDIYHSLIEDTLKWYYEALEDAVKGVKSPLAQIRKAIDMTLEILQENRAFMEFLAAEFRPSAQMEDNELARKSMDWYIRLVEFFSTRFSEAVKLGEVVDIPPNYLAIGLLGNIFIFGSYWCYFEQKDFNKAQRELIPRLFFDRVALK
jgi:TetR/AcrR family transcriptional regulator